MFRTARRIATIALIAGAALPVANASAVGSKVTFGDLVISSATPEPTYLTVKMKETLVSNATPEATALLLPAIQAAREAARRCSC